MQRIIVLFLMLMTTASLALAQDIIRVTGKVTSKTKNLPLMGVNVMDTDTKRVMAQTDPDGRFAIDVRSNSTLVFTMIGAKKESVKIKNRNYIEIQMEEEDVFLNVADVVVKRIEEGIQPEKTTIEIRGNWAIIPTRVRIQHKTFGKDCRAVIQPVVNNVTRNQKVLLRPLVYDAATYHATQDRMYDFDMEGENGDPLAEYVMIQNDSLKEKSTIVQTDEAKDKDAKGKKAPKIPRHMKKRHNDIVGYKDSVYLDNVKDDFNCEVFIAIENYHKVILRDTTIIANGTVNPLRWLKYDLAAQNISDTTLYPKAEMQLRDSKGQIDLRFPVGKAEFDVNDPHNVQEIAKLDDQVRSVIQTPDATLQALAIEGTSSPDGLYKKNLNLANQRMSFALKYLKERIPATMRANMKFSSKAEVAPWSEVVSLLRKDSLYDEAEKLESIVKRVRKMDDQGKQIRKLSFYRLLLEKYLPMLRSVGYSMNYSIFRKLTIDEIKALYQKDYRQLSRYEYFRLYRADTVPESREKILRQALEIYPSFMLAANDLQVMLIERDSADANLLGKFAGEKAPLEVNMNHAIALVMNGKATAADSVIAYIPEQENTRLLRAVCNALNGHYKESYATIAETGLQNQAAMLLAMKKNQDALKVVEQLPEDEALTHYLLAICYNRLEKPLEAYEALKRAFKKDPSLEKIARLDGDVNSLILDKEKK